MTRSPSSLSICSRDYDVYEFKGTEDLNSKFTFSIKFIGYYLEDFDNLLNTKATLVMRGEDGFSRKWTGLVTSISVKHVERWIQLVNATLLLLFHVKNFNRTFKI